jgi:beta-lactamase superfamily II metal-dependent hydrolase
MSVVENDLAAEKGQFTVNVLDVGGGDRVEIAIPDGDVRVFTGFERADAVFQK